MTRIREDSGTIVIWILGLCVGLLFLGGFSLDVWRAFTERRVLAGMADGAVVAGATAIDESVWRSTGVIQLDGAMALDRADVYLTSHPSWDSEIAQTITVGPAGIEVVLETDVEFTLLRIPTLFHRDQVVGWLRQQRVEPPDDDSPQPVG